MNIGIVCYPTYGGSGIMATELGKELAQRGHTVHLFSYAQPIRIANQHEKIYFHRVEPNAYPLFSYPSYSLEIAARIVDVAQNQGLDLIHAHYAIPHGMSALEAREILLEQNIKLPFITTLHGTDITIVGSEPAMAPLTRYILRHSNRVTAVSHCLREETRTFFQVERQIDVIPNFIDPAVFRRRPMHQLRQQFAGDHCRILLHTSNFRPVKNIPDLIRMFALVQTRVESRLVLVGDGPERPRAEQLARTLGLADKVFFIGMQPNVADFFSIADLYVQASQTESFGLSSLEAMACRVPVVSYRVGGVPEVVIHGETGLLVEYGDVDGLAAAAVNLLECESRWKRFCCQSRRRAESEFAASRIIPLYEKLYSELLSAN